MKKNLYTTAAILLSIILASMGTAGCVSVTSKPQYDAEGNLLAPENYGKVTLGKYKGLAAKETILPVTEEDIQIEIDYFLNQTDSYTGISDRPVREGDVALVSFSGTIDGIPFEGGTGEEEVKVGSGNLWPGFEDGLVGMKTGETKDISVVFPKDYPETAYAGRTAVFTTTLNEIRIENNTEFNDDWVVEQTHGECRTTEEFREKCRKDLERAMSENARAGAQAELLKQVVEASAFSLNRTAVEYEYMLQRNEFENFIRGYGMDMDSYLAAFRSDSEKFEAEMRELAEESVKERLVTEAIAAKEGIAPDEAAEFLYNNATIER